VGRFQVEGPKILTKLDFETREIPKFVIEFWRGLALGGKRALLLWIAKVTFWILPAVIWISEYEGEGFEARISLVVEEGWTKNANFVNIWLLDEVDGEVEYEGEDDGGEVGEDDGGEVGEGVTVNPDWGEIGNIWSPTSWFVVCLLPYASSNDSAKLKVCTVPAAATLG
jgi:hypothetical protein